MSKLEIIRNLRERLEASSPKTLEHWNHPGSSQVVTKGILVELTGHARTEWMLDLFKANPEPFIFWCERESSVNPTAIYQRGINLERIKFVISSGDLQQPLRMALESGHYGFVVAPNRFKDVRIFQRLSLVAEKSKSTLFLLAQENLSNAWPIALQLDINFGDHGLVVDAVRSKVGISL